MGSSGHQIAWINVVSLKPSCPPESHARLSPNHHRVKWRRVKSHTSKDEATLPLLPQAQQGGARLRRILVRKGIIPLVPTEDLFDSVPVVQGIDH